MKAIVFDAPGEPSVLQIGEIDEPRAADSEIVIDVHGRRVRTRCLPILRRRRDRLLEKLRNLRNC